MFLHNRPHEQRRWLRLAVMLLDSFAGVRVLAGPWAFAVVARARRAADSAGIPV
jgi:hypothetical protein